VWQEQRLRVCVCATLGVRGSVTRRYSRKMILLPALALLLGSLPPACRAARAEVVSTHQQRGGGSSPLEQLARLELQRYTALSTTSDGGASAGGHLRLALMNLALGDGGSHPGCVSGLGVGHRLEPQEHVIRRCEAGSTGPHFVLAGGDEHGVLFCVWAFVEAVLGVRFSIAGDRLPEPRPLAAILSSAQGLGPQLQHVRSPRFARRGLQPFVSSGHSLAMMSDSPFRPSPMQHLLG
jgi:hypothetical protein